MPESNQPEPRTAPDSPPSQGPPDSRRAVIGTCVLLVVAVLLVFGRATRHDFVNFDDPEYLSANPQVQSGLSLESVVWAFRTTSASNWHPLTWLSLMVDVELFGKGPLGPHLTNVLLHAANTALLFLLLRRMTGAHYRSAFVAALFALHPMHVESVAWVAERKDVLCAFFGLLCLLAYTRFARETEGGSRRPEAGSRRPEAGSRRPEGGSRRSGGGSRRSEVGSQGSEVGSRRSEEAGRIADFRLPTSEIHPPSTIHHPLSSSSYALALLCFALSLMSKPMLVTLPFVLLLLDYWPLRRLDLSTLNPQPSTIRRLVLEKLPFLALAAASCIATLIAQKDAMQPLTHISFGIRIVNAVVTCVRYLFKMFFPVNLAIPYPHHGYWPVWVFCLCALLLLAATAVALRLRRRLPFLVTGWFWYLGMLVPVIGLVQVGMQSMADRYTYLPFIGVFLLLTWLGAEILRRWRLPAAVSWSLAVLLLTACALRTLDQLRYWQNSETLFQHAIAVTRGNDVAHCNLGEHYFRKGRLEDAVRHYLEAIRIRPSYDDALNNLGAALAMKGDLDAAAARIREAIRWRPDKADAHYNLGNVLVLQRRPGEAAAAYTEALRLKPDYAEAHNNLANVLFLQGDRDAARRHYQEALRLNPNHEGARRQLRALGAQLPP